MSKKRSKKKPNCKKSKKPISYNNPVFLNYALSGDDPDSQELRRILIKELTGNDCKETRVIKPECPPLSYEEMYDLWIEDENGCLYNICFRN